MGTSWRRPVTADVEAHACALDPEVGVGIEVETPAVVRLKNVRP